MLVICGCWYSIHQRLEKYLDWLKQKSRDDNYKISNFSGYKSSVHPGIAHVFQSAAMRWGHTLVPPGVYRRTGYDASNPKYENKKADQAKMSTNYYAL